MDGARLVSLNAREAAYEALLASLRHEDFIVSSLKRWQNKDHPSPRDFAFAYEIASGAARMALSLDYIATQLSDNKKLSLKVKEKALLRAALYQYYFMTKVPLYAIVNETVELAKKYCHRSFVGYLNALLRRLENTTLQLPEDLSVPSLSIRYSYPSYFIAKLISDYGQETAINVLKAGNTSPITTARMRSEAKTIWIDDPSQIQQIAESTDYYIQNATPIDLINELASRTKSPASILDLCSSPGGKLLAAHDIFPEAQLFANDVSEEKIKRLSENLTKYGVKATLTCGDGSLYPNDRSFDVVILDVPCSNSGVLNKRHEARWRLTEDALKELKVTQQKLLQNSVKLIGSEGIIWYLTCSILKDENERLLQELCSGFGLEIVYTKTILPNENGWDGGFAALLNRHKRA